MKKDGDARINIGIPILHPLWTNTVLQLRRQSLNSSQLHAITYHPFVNNTIVQIAKAYHAS